MRAVRLNAWKSEADLEDVPVPSRTPDKSSSRSAAPERATPICT